MGNLIMLPFSGRLYVCRERSGHVEPLAELPGANDSQAVVKGGTKPESYRAIPLTPPNSDCRKVLGRVGAEFSRRG